MDSIFSVEPPQWLQRIAQPVDGNEIGKDLGALLVGGGRFASDEANGRPANFAKSVQDVYQATADPMIRLRRASIELQNAKLKADTDLAIQTADLHRNEIINQHKDATALSSLLAPASGDPQKILTAISSFFPSSTIGFHNAQQVRMSAAQSLQRQAQTKQATDYVKTVSEISSIDSSLVTPDMYLGGETPLPTPEQFSKVNAAKLVLQERGRAAAAAAAENGQVTTQVAPSGAVTTTIKPNSSSESPNIDFTDLPNGQTVMTYGKQWRVLDNPQQKAELGSLQKQMDSELIKERQALAGLNKEGISADTKTEARRTAVAARSAYESLHQKTLGLLNPKKDLTNQSSPATKVDMANQLSQEHPNWTREQIISEVNQKFTK